MRTLTRSAGVWLFQIVAVGFAIPNVVKVPEKHAHGPKSGGALTDDHISNPRRISTPSTVSPINVGMDVANGYDVFRLNFVLGFNSTNCTGSPNSTNTTHIQQMHEKRDKLLHALRDENSAIHAALRNGKTAKVLQQILERRALVAPTSSTIDVGIRLFDRDSSAVQPSAGQGRRAAEQLSVKVRAPAASRTAAHRNHFLPFSCIPLSHPSLAPLSLPR
jgi:hypothetical protein